MQKTISNWLTAAVIIASLALTAGLFSPIAKAEETKTDQSANSQANDYVYKTPSKGSLTALVRKSLLLYDQENESINLTKAGIIYAETNMVRQLGPRQLEVNEQVTVPRSLVEEYAKKATELTDAQQKAWQSYSAGVDFELSQINITQGTSSTGTTQNDQAGNTAPEATESEEANKQGSKPTETKPKDNSVWSWALVVAATLAIGYYIFGSHNKQPASTTKKTTKKAAPKKQTRKSKK